MSQQSEDEFLTTSGMPNWVRWAAGVAAIALVVVLLMVKAGAHSGGSPTSPSPSTSTEPAVAAPVVSTAVHDVALPYSVAHVDQVVADAGVTWVLKGRSLLRHGGGSAQWQSVPVAAPGGTPTLTLEREEHQLWVFAIGATQTRLQAFDARTLHPLVSVEWPHQVLAAAALRRGLYVTGPAGLFRVNTDGLATRISLPPANRILDIVADPTRDRLLTLVGAKAGFVVMELGDIARTVSAPAPSDLIKGRLGVTASGAIWLAGYGRSGAILDRLDPGSLRAVTVSPLVGQLGPGASVLASGDHSLLVESGGGGPEMWCVDDQAGAPAELWNIGPEMAAVSSGLGYAVIDLGLVRLELAGRCTG